MKRIVSIFLLIALFLSSAGCSADKGETNPKEDTLDKNEAISIASDLIRRYQTYDNIGIACDLDWSYDYSEKEYSDIWNLLSESQQNYLARPEKCTCCKTYEQAKEHLLRCIDGSLLKYTTEDYVIYNGDLYFFMGNVGGVSFQNARLIEFDKDKIIAYADQYNSGDMLCATYSFDIRKEETGYIIKNVEEIPITRQKIPVLGSDPKQKPWMYLYRPLLAGFYDSEYARKFTDQTVPVLFDITDDGIPELFVFCAMGARGLALNGYMFAVKGGGIEAFYVDDFGYGSGSYDNIRLFRNQEGETFALMSSLSENEKDALKTYGNTITKLIFDGNDLKALIIAKNLGTNHIGEYETDTFMLNEKNFDTFDLYYDALSSYLSSLTEVPVKSSVKSVRAPFFPIGLYGICYSDIDELFSRYENS